MTLDHDCRLLAGKVFKVATMTLSAIEADSPIVRLYKIMFDLARRTMPRRQSVRKMKNGMCEVLSCDMMMMWSTQGISLKDGVPLIPIFLKNYPSVWIIKPDGRWSHCYAKFTGAVEAQELRTIPPAVVELSGISVYNKKLKPATFLDLCNWNSEVYLDCTRDGDLLVSMYLASMLSYIYSALTCYVNLEGSRQHDGGTTSMQCPR